MVLELAQFGEPPGDRRRIGHLDAVAEGFALPRGVLDCGANLRIDRTAEQRLEVERAGVRTTAPVMAELSGDARRTTRLLLRGALSAPAEEVARLRAAGLPVLLAD